MTIDILGIDIAKNVFQLHGVNHHGCVVLKRRVMRDQLLDIVAQVERCTIVVEACTGAFCLSLSQTSSGWRLTENRAMLSYHEGPLQAHWLDGCRSVSVAGNA